MIQPVFAMRSTSRKVERAIGLFIAVASAAAVAATNVPTIVVDAAHNDIVKQEGVKTLSYVIAPGASVRLDARKFDYTQAGYPNLRPNAVHVTIKDRQYFADWGAAAQVLELSSDTLVPVNNGPRFEGFRSGDSVTINLGKKDVDEVKHEISFKVQWSALLKVK
jgi:hypothetical protein